MFNYFAKRRARKIFSKYVPANVVDNILDKSLVDDSGWELLIEKQIDFVCVEVRGDTPANISEKMGLVSDLAFKHGGTVASMISGLVVIVFGLIHDDNADHKDLLAALQNQFKTDIRLVYGSGLAACGILGNRNFGSFSFVLPNFLELFPLLLSLPFGQICGWKPKSRTMPSSESRETRDR